MAYTLALCQQLVAQLAAVAAEQVLEQSSILRVIYREYQQQVIAAAGTTTINLCTDAGADAGAGAVADTNVVDDSFTLSVTRLLADPRYFSQTVAQIARLYADAVDTFLLSAFAQEFLGSPLGAGGNAITDAVIAQAAGTLDAAETNNGEVRYLALSTLSGAGALLAGGTYGEVLALASAIDQTKAGPGTVQSNYLLNRVPRWRGFSLLPSPNTFHSGTGPMTTWNVAFTTTAAGLVTVQRALTNDGTHVQAYSQANDSTFGIVVFLAFNSANDVQNISFGMRCRFFLPRPSFYVVVKT